MICSSCQDGDHGACKDGEPLEMKDGVVLCDCASTGHTGQ